MGQEARCTVHIDGKTFRAKALLETDEIVVRGGVRLTIPLRSIQSLEAEDGCLTVTYPGGAVAFDLGPQAEAWARTIRNPKSLLDKLGVKPGSRVSVLGVSDAAFWRQLRAVTSDVAEGKLQQDSDVILLQVANKEELGRIARARDHLKKDGALWVVWPKGRKDLKESDVMAAGKEAGLVDVKVAKFSETLSALKQVIPRAKR